jgi:hypothetical protein
MSEVVVKSRGRKVNPSSARQARLAAWEAKRAAGLEVKRGRPSKGAPVVQAPKQVPMEVLNAMEVSSNKKSKK